MLYVNFFPATFLRFFRTQIVLLQSVRNTIDEEERADGRHDSKGNFVEDIVADIDSLFDFSKAGEKKSCEEEESLTIELENLSLLEDFNHHRKSSANSTDSPRGEYLKRRRSSRDDDETVISLQVCDDEEK